ncbi:hypothetical protein CONCODRAFT_80479 [Conidiobolus coronatus NRRL 28638]|uniref:Uncharacterized protein n=1 Tax=Conidiobolus coronatus (strain ATCC 28846 / CBS 209.66 / NRRL 28638) TaxID=796925 RepID=A0A137NUY9_CONC2|nr:hypothetical protein CONCODRAFT_80479 [Conidiobolus coronatus NRRL 28638]|eukprot:KXN66481.1 hypothetical protein CONCODRAFT_80479 [Conidiobolus coronatus NRRL 28638]
MEKKKKGRKLKFTDEYIINLVDENPDLNAAELAEIAGVTKRTLLSRIKQIKDNGKSINYCLKKLKFTDEYLIDLINNNPYLSMEKLGRVVGVSVTCIRYRINKVNSNGEKVKYTKKKYNSDGFEGSFPKLTDGRLINLIKENPDFSMEELAYLANVSTVTVSKRIKKINNSSITPIYQRKDMPKLTDEALIDLVNKNPELNMKELADIEGVSESTIKKSISRINKGKERVSYRNKGAQKISDEALIELINKNPELNMKELAETAGVTQNTISKRIKQINSSGKVINYVYKNSQKGKSKANDKPKCESK